MFSTLFKFLRIKFFKQYHNSDREDSLFLTAHESGLKDGSIQLVNPKKIVSKSACPQIPHYYRDLWFQCKDCGTKEMWTAVAQKRWYEEQGGVIESKAIRCNDCRRKERQRKSEAREAHFRGLRKNKNK